MTNEDETLQEISIEDVHKILKTYGLPEEVDNINLYRRAFVHNSFFKKTKSNERLEFLGDGILEFVTKLYLYKRFPKANEGFLTEKKIRIVKNETIGRLAVELQLDKWILESKTNKQTIRNLGCFFESFVSAIFLDFNKRQIGFQMVQTFIENVYEKHLNWHDIIHKDDNFKNQLQILMQREYKVTPHYILIDHDAYYGYRVGVYLCMGYGPEKSLLQPMDATLFSHYFDPTQPQFMFLGEGIHKNKRKAEQFACQNALHLIFN